MGIKIGTSNFVNKKCAVKYYKVQGVDEETVNEYLLEGLITIGKPDYERKEEICVDENGRYFIRDYSK